ncbi:MAG TPA: pilus assembly protein N-terminal domain-containing protein [Rhizomicrobium sp.]
MRRTTALLATLLLTVGAAQARSASVSVPLDEVRMLTFAQPISTLYIGNPAVADVTMIDKRHAFVLGKSYGATNIVALDASGAEISNQQVVVSGSTGGAVVTLQRGAARTTYSCAARCEPSPKPGDGKDFDGSMDQIAKHQQFVAKFASDQAQ